MPRINGFLGGLNVLYAEQNYVFWSEYRLPPMQLSEFEINVSSPRSAGRKKTKKSIYSQKQERTATISHPKFGKIYVELTTFSIGKTIEIRLRSGDCGLSEFVYRRIFRSVAFAAGHTKNIFPLKYINNRQVHGYTLSKLNAVANMDVMDFVATKNMELYIPSDSDSRLDLSVVHEYNDYKGLVLMYLASVLLPYVRDHQKVLKVHTSSHWINIRNYVLRLIAWTVAVVGLFTLANRERIGATCYDGSSSGATSSGACSYHGGVRSWEYTYWWEKDED